MCSCTWVAVYRGQEDVKSPGPGIIGGCELPNMDTGNQTLAPLQEQCALTTGSSLQWHTWIVLFVYDSTSLKRCAKLKLKNNDFVHFSLYNTYVI